MSYSIQENKSLFTKTTMASAIAIAMGGASATVSALTVNFDWSGALTLVEPSGTSSLFNSAQGSHMAPYWGYRTAISGTMSIDLDTGIATATMDPFSFLGAGNAIATTITFQAIGNGFGGQGSLVLGNMGFNWGGNEGIPISVVMDAAGLFGYFIGADPNATPSDGFTSDVLSGFGTLAATNDWVWASGGQTTFSLPMGPSPMVTTTWDTSAIGTTMLGDNPSGALPLIADTSPGSPMSTAPFAGHMANFDITSMRVTIPGTIPPSATIVIPGGAFQECDAAGGSSIPVNTQVTVPEDDAVDTISWLLDGNIVASGESVTIFVPLGTHTLGVALNTILGKSATDSQAVTVRDSIRPAVSAAFVNRKTGADINTIDNQGKVGVSIGVSDVCDPDPEIISTVGLPVEDGDMLRIRTPRRNSDMNVSVNGMVGNVELTVIAEDESGNMSSDKAVLTVTP